LIPVLERPGIESGREEEMDGVRHKLPICVGVAAKDGCLDTFFDASEEDFRSIGS
jgi:hypothetical protein